MPMQRELWSLAVLLAMLAALVWAWLRPGQVHALTRYFSDDDAPAQT